MSGIVALTYVNVYAGHDEQWAWGGDAQAIDKQEILWSRIRCCPNTGSAKRPLQRKTEKVSCRWLDKSLGSVGAFGPKRLTIVFTMRIIAQRIRPIEYTMLYIYGVKNESYGCPPTGGLWRNWGGDGRKAWIFPSIHATKVLSKVAQTADAGSSRIKGNPSPVAPIHIKSGWKWGRPGMNGESARNNGRASCNARVVIATHSN